MGMAASQARLLSITARLADNELRSQTINNAKMRLATQSSQASENYINALNQANYQFTNYDQTGGVVSQPLTYNALTAYSPYNTQYGLVNSAGQILVSEAEAAIYEKSQGNLDAFLKEHGLEYSTTYFENLDTDGDGIAKENDSYPAPFKIISVENMQKMFEQYNSFENSTEVEKFEKAFNDMDNHADNLQDALSGAMKSYLLHGQNTITSITSNNNEGFEYNGTTDVTTMINNIKAVFLTNSSYQLNINNLKGKGLISESLFNNIDNVLKGIKNPVGGNIQLEEECDVDSKEVIGADGKPTGSTIYTIDGEIVITVGSDGKVSAFNDDKLRDSETKDYKKDSTDSTDTVTYARDTNGKAITGVTLAEALNNFGYTVTTGTAPNQVTRKYKYAMDSDGKVEKTTTLSASEAKEYLNNMINYIMNLIISEADYGNFAKFISTTPEGTLPGLGITKTEDMKKAIDDYDNAKDGFLGVIFGDSASINAVKQDIANGATIVMKGIDGQPLKDENDKVIEKEVNIDNLQDIDFILQYMASKPELKRAAGFDTVIQEFLIDNLIDEYGTPKYAWIDENDKDRNQGNADAKAQWYTNLFHRMQRGYKALENGLASSKEWIEYALENGTVYLEQVDQAFAWNALDFKTCSRITEETNDKAVAKAEAEYNRAMNDIKTKDNIYDLELKNIDTEHNALQTEYDVIKGVINKNIERNFKFNQSA